MCAASSLPFAWHHQQPQFWRLGSIYAGCAIAAQTTGTEIWVQKQWKLCAAIRHRPSSVVISQIIAIDAYLHTCWQLCSCSKSNDISFAVTCEMLHTKQGYHWRSNTTSGYSVAREAHDLVLWKHTHWWSSAGKRSRYTNVVISFPNVLCYFIHLAAKTLW